MIFQSFENREKYTILVLIMLCYFWDCRKCKIFTSLTVNYCNKKFWMKKITLFWSQVRLNLHPLKVVFTLNKFINFRKFCSNGRIFTIAKVKTNVPIFSHICLDNGLFLIFNVTNTFNIEMVQKGKWTSNKAGKITMLIYNLEQWKERFSETRFQSNSLEINRISWWKYFFLCFWHKIYTYFRQSQKPSCDNKLC